MAPRKGKIIDLYKFRKIGNKIQHGRNVTVTMFNLFYSKWENPGVVAPLLVLRSSPYNRKLSIVSCKVRKLPIGKIHNSNVKMYNLYSGKIQIV